MFGSTTQGKSYIYDKNHGVILQKMAAVFANPSLWLSPQPQFVAACAESP